MSHVINNLHLIRKDIPFIIYGSDKDNKASISLAEKVNGELFTKKDNTVYYKIYIDRNLTHNIYKTKTLKEDYDIYREYFSEST